MTPEKQIEYLKDILKWNDMTIKLIEAHALKVPTSAMAVGGATAVLLGDLYLKEKQCK